MDSSAGPAQRGLVFVDVIDQYLGHAVGTANVRGVPEKAFFQEKDRASSFTGDIGFSPAAPGSELHLTGDVLQLPDGTQTLQMAYTPSSLGQSDEGTITMVQVYGGPGWANADVPPAAGDYCGTSGGGPMDAVLNQAGSSLGGTIDFAFSTFAFNFVGTIVPDGTTHGLAQSADPAIQSVTVDGLFDPTSATIAGTLQILRADGSMNSEAFLLGPCIVHPGS